MSLFDLIATDMRASFTTTPDLRAYTAVEPKQSLFERNPKLSAMTGPLRQGGARRRWRMRFDVPDAAPTDRLNRIVWGLVQWLAIEPYPARPQGRVLARSRSTSRTTSANGRSASVFGIAALALAVAGPAAVEVAGQVPLPVLHETVSVTAVREEARPYDLPRSITVIDQAELAERLPRTTPEALWDAAGVFVQKTNHGGGSPYLRGLVGNQILILVDGIRLNNSTFRYGPNQYLATIDPAVVERIEVVRGSGSVLYGSDAMGGVINIVTRRPGVGETGLRGKASTKFMTGGMEQSGRFELAATSATAGVSGGLSVRNFGDLRAGGTLGVEAPSGYAEIAGDLRGEIALSPHQRFTFSYQHHRQEDVPRYDQVAQRGFARYGFDPQVRQLGYLRYERSSASGWRHMLRATASLNRSTEQREYQRRQSPTLTSERDQVLTTGLSIELQSRLRPWLSLVSGLDYYHDAIESARRDVDQATGGSLDRRGLYPNGAAADSAALFAHATVSGTRWRVDTGVRASRFEVRAPDPMFGSARIAPSTATGSVGALYTLADGVRVFGSVSQGFRAPNVDDLSSLGQFDFGMEVPSPGLRPESLVTVEGGLKLRGGSGTASVSVYRTSLADLIDRVRGSFDGSPLLNDQNVYQKANIGSGLVRGVEIEAEYRLTASLTGNGFLTYTYGHASRNEPLRRIPPLNGLVALRYSDRRASVGRGRPSIRRPTGPAREWGPRRSSDSRWRHARLDRVQRQRRLSLRAKARARRRPPEPVRRGLSHARLRHRRLRTKCLAGHECHALVDTRDSRRAG